MSGDLQLKKDGFTFTWIIEDFIYKNKLIVSPGFVAESLNKTEWCLNLYPKGEKQSGGRVKVVLWRKKDSGPPSCTVGYETSIVSSNGSRVLKMETDYEAFVKLSSSEKSMAWDRDELLNKKDFYLPDNVLTIQCHMWTPFAPEPTYNRCTAVTRSDVEKVSFKKSIKNFGAFYSGHRVTIPIPLSGNFEMILRVEKSAYGDCLLTDIRRTGEFQQSHLFCKLSLLNAVGIPQASKEDEHLFVSQKEAIWSFPPFTEFEKLKQRESSFLKNDILEMQCEMAVSSGEEKSQIVGMKYVPPNEISEDKVILLKTLSENLSRLYTEKKFSDVELRVGNKSFPAHRFLLSARSPVFEAMFQSDMVEKTSGFVHISDVDAQTVDMFLKFVYSATVEELHFESAAKLFAMADKYEVLELKEKCLPFLQQNITLENVCNVLQIAKLYQIKELKSTAESFFCEHSDEILRSDSWQEIISHDISMATEMMGKLSRMYFKK